MVSSSENPARVLGSNLGRGPPRMRAALFQPPSWGSRSGKVPSKPNKKGSSRARILENCARRHGRDRNKGLMTNVVAVRLPAEEAGGIRDTQARSRGHQLSGQHRTEHKAETQVPVRNLRAAVSQHVTNRLGPSEPTVKNLRALTILQGGECLSQATGTSATKYTARLNPDRKYGSKSLPSFPHIRSYPSFLIILQGRETFLAFISYTQGLRLLGYTSCPVS